MTSSSVECLPEILPPNVDRKLLVVRGRSGVRAQAFDEDIMRNQRELGRDTSDPLSIVRAHQFLSRASREIILGVREVTTRRLLMSFGEEQVEFIEANPFVRNIWIGEHVGLFSAEEAATRHFAGRTALQWASMSSPSPEMVVQANDGYFYPATKNDTVINETTDWTIYPVKRALPSFKIYIKPRQE